MTNTISIGKNITVTEDVLQPVAVAEVYNMLVCPPPEVASLIQQLRIVRQLDARQYAVQKKRLPYIVCGQFNPALRRTEAFAYTEYFILDVDHLSDKDINLSLLRETLKMDRRVVMCFVSPGGDGLKILFHLKERCYDAGLYHACYKAFATHYAVEHDLVQALDAKTCDVARACFLSCDAEAYYNPSAEDVDWSVLASEERSRTLFGKNAAEAVPLQPAPPPQAAQSAPLPAATADSDLPDTVMDNIRSILEMNKKKAAGVRAVFVPEKLAEIIGDLQHYIEATGVSVVEIDDIQYGKKIKTRLGQKMAETNVFYGKRGFSAVASPKSGTNPELNTMMAELIHGYLWSL